MLDYITFTIRGIPPSYNKSCKINFNFKEVYLSNEARYFKVKVKMSMPPTAIPANSKFILVTTYHSNWYYKAGSIRKRDVQNMNRLLIDAIFEKLGTDDSYLWFISEWKEQSEEEKTVINLFWYPADKELDLKDKLTSLVQSL